MTSCYGTDPNLDFSFFYDRQAPAKQTNKNSLLYILENEPKLSMFRYLVKLSNLDPYFNNLQTNATLFVPTDDYIKQQVKLIENMDVNTAYKIVCYSTVPKKVSKSGLMYYSMYKLDTRCNGYPLMIDTTNGENNIVINRDSNTSQVSIIKTNIQAENGYIHIVDNLLIPQSIY